MGAGGGRRVSQVPIGGRAAGQVRAGVGFTFSAFQSQSHGKLPT